MKIQRDKFFMYLWYSFCFPYGYFYLTILIMPCLSYHLQFDSLVNKQPCIFCSNSCCCCNLSWKNITPSQITWQNQRKIIIINWFPAQIFSFPSSPLEPSLMTASSSALLLNTTVHVTTTIFQFKSESKNPTPSATTTLDLILYTSTAAVEPLTEQFRKNVALAAEGKYEFDIPSVIKRKTWYAIVINSLISLAIRLGLNL